MAVEHRRAHHQFGAPQADVPAIDLCFYGVFLVALLAFAGKGIDVGRAFQVKLARLFQLVAFYAQHGMGARAKECKQTQNKEY